MSNSQSLAKSDHISSLFFLAEIKKPGYKTAYLAMHTLCIGPVCDKGCVGLSPTFVWPITSGGSHNGDVTISWEEQAT